jgi:hypothetical protein
MLLAVVLSQGNPNRNVQTYLTNATASVPDPVSDHRSMVRQPIKRVAGSTSRQRRHVGAARLPPPDERWTARP